MESERSKSREEIIGADEFSFKAFGEKEGKNIAGFQPTNLLASEMKPGAVRDALKAEKPFAQKYKKFRVRNQTIEGNRIWSDEYLLTEYTKNTDRLIGLLDGTIPIQDAEREGPADAVIWLDKSARPLSWMKRKLWPVLARTPGTYFDENVVPIQPKDYYLNIDREYWLGLMGVPFHEIQDASEGSIDVSKIDKDFITRIRALFSVKRIDESDLDEAWDYPTVLDGQNVVVVDEVQVSGSTLKIARELIKHAIPDIKIGSAHWAIPNIIPLGKGVRDNRHRIQFTREWVPVWYKQNSASGRGVGDRDSRYPEKLEAKGDRAPSYSKLGRYVLSTPFHDPHTLEKANDLESKYMRDDVDRLVQDVRAGKVFFKPASERDYEDFVLRVKLMNSMSLDEWIERRNQLEPQRR